MALHNNGGNFTNVGVVQLDDEGNMLTCPHCGSTHIIKRGKDKHIVGTPQRYECRDCGKKTNKPKVHFFRGPRFLKVDSRFSSIKLLAATN